MIKKVIPSLIIGICGVFIAIGILMLVGSTESTGFQFSYQASALTDKEQGKYAQNNILFYNDECLPAGNSVLNSGGTNIAGSGFKIDGSTDPNDLWYAEGCLNNGECTVPDPYADGGVYLSTNPFLFSATKVDMDFGGLQYIYAENYDINYDVWPPKFTEKTGPKSNRKYYWIVLPAYAYSNGLGETYVAKFENVSEPVYFITFDTHAPGDQNAGYCRPAANSNPPCTVDDPENTLIGKEFLGAFTYDGGNYTPIAKLAGKLTYFHRIAGAGEVLVKENASGGFAIGGDSSSSGSGDSSSNPSASSTSTPTTATTKNDNNNSGGTSFKIDSSISASDFFYAEGCIDNGTCVCSGGGNYCKYSKAEGAGSGRQSFLRDETQSDDSLGGWQYIYADNYDIDYQWPPTFTRKTGVNSTRKYYWVVLPADVYTKSFGETYVATFENLSEPIYLITYDAHACEHQHLSGRSYCSEDMNTVTAGKGLIGPFTKTGDYKELANKIGKLTSLHRIAGSGQVDAPESASAVAPGGGSCSLATVEIPSYSQCSSDWGNNTYGSGTICSRGCGPSSMAMLVSVLTGQTVYPADIIEVTSSAQNDYPNSDVGYELTQMVAEKYNLEAEKITYSNKQDAYDKMKKYLNDGYVIHLSGAGSHPGFSNSNTDGHYIGLVSIDKDDKVRVANSNPVGNNTTDLQNIADAIHNGAFVILKNKDGSACSGSSGGSSGGSTIDPCDDGSSGLSGGSSSSNAASGSASTECGKKVLTSAAKIIGIASQYGFDYSQDYHDISSEYDEILKGRAFKTDCTGFASFVMYDAFGTKQVFWTGDIKDKSDYKEIPKDQVQVGDIFNYNYGCTAHGGIITKIENGKIVEIAQTGNGRGQNYLTSGTSSKNNRLGYSYYPNLDNGNLDCVNGKATDLKFYRYKECK